MRVMGWVEWDEDGMSTCVLDVLGWSGCCQVLRSKVYTEQERFVPTSGMYLQVWKSTDRCM